MKFVCEKCAHEIGGMPPYARFKAFCPNCKKLAWFARKINDEHVKLWPVDKIDI